MALTKTRSLPRTALSLALLLSAATTLPAQGRLVLPAGSVIIVRTNSALESTTARVGQTFETTVADSVGVDNYTVIPSGSRIRGNITFAQAANRQQSGVIEVNFDRITLPDGTTYPIVGRLTSTDATERRQIDADPNSRVVLVGGRGGIGAAIAGAGSSNSPASGILGALGALLSQAQDVRVAAGTPLAVQLDQQAVLRGRGRARASDAFTIYTSVEAIREAQQALAQQNYYRGSINGQLDDATQSALFAYQADRGLVATGNLDGRTAQSLGLTLSTAGGSVGGGSSFGAVLSPEDASILRRGSQALLTRERQELALSSLGRLDTRRTYSDSDIELWFAISAFADNSSLYEQLVRVSGNAEGSAYAGRALVNAARRVDSALMGARPSGQFRNAWATLRAQVSEIDPNYR